MRRLLLATALLLTLIVPATVAAAAPTARISWTRAGTTLTTNTTGGPATTGAWRTELRGAGGTAYNHILRVTVTTSDIEFTGVMEDLLVTATGTRVISRVDITPYINGTSSGAAIAIRDTTLKVYVSSTDIKVPANGNRTLSVKFRGLAVSAHALIRGSARIASEAFRLGPWRSTPWARV